MSTEGPILGGIHEVKGAANNLEIIHLARFAVRNHKSESNKLLEFVKVLKASMQVVAGAVYYITLEATLDGKKSNYYATIWVKPWLNFKEVLDFKKLLRDDELSSPPNLKSLL